MKEHEFYSLYGNMPLKERDKDYGGTSATKIYFEMKHLDEKTRPLEIRKQELLRLAEIIFKFYK